MDWRLTGPDLELPVACGGGHHRLVWSRGAVALADHPDVAAELALIALGGPEPACLAQLRLWREAVADGGFLAEWVDENHLSPARLSWLATALDRLRLEGFHEFLRHLPPARAERMGQFLHRFPRPWLDRAACEVAEAVADGRQPGCTQAAALIPVAAAQRLRRSFVASVGGRLVPWGAAALVPLSIEVEPGLAPSATGSLTGAGRSVVLRAPSSWLHRVWGAGAAVVDDHLVLDLIPASGCDAALLVVDWVGPIERLQPRTQLCQAHYDGTRWRLASM